MARSGDAARVEWDLSLTMPLGWLAQRGSRIDEAEAEVAVARAEAQALRREVLLQLRTAFWALAHEQARVAALEALAEQTDALVATVSRRVAKGEVRPVELTRVEIEREKVAAELEAARAARGARQAELALWIDAPAGALLVAVADLGAPPVAPDRAGALALARASHPALALARAKARAFAAAVGAERMGRVPSIALSGFASHELDRRAYGVGLAVDLPLWSWNAGRIAQAEAKRAASAKQAEAARRDIEGAVLEAQAACQAAAATATRLQRNVVPRAEAAAFTMEKTYRLGEASLLEVIDARRTLLDARRLSLSALAQAQIDCSRLGALVGEEPR
jgi:cobalt-zinc-cadmium efflux system outer membrane protein